MATNAGAEPIGPAIELSSVLERRSVMERTGALRAWLAAIPWATVLPLALVLAFADGFWMISLRGAVGAIERTQGPFSSWLFESTLSIPLFALVVLGALTLAARWFGPTLRRPKAVLVAALLVVAGATLVGIAEIAASSAIDYHLQAAQLQFMAAMPSMPDMGPTSQQLQATLGLQVRAVGYGGWLVLVTNLIAVGWVTAMRGGRLNARKTRP
jgi:hypothetical protein